MVLTNEGEGMQPIKFFGYNVEFAKDQPQYFTLPGYRCPNDMRGQVVFCWQLSWRERLSVLLFGKLWHSVLTFNNPLQPMKLQTEKFDGLWPK